MTNWEYKTVTVTRSLNDHDLSHMLNRHAGPENGSAAGWEIFATEPWSGGVRLFMKRPATEPAAAATG